MLISRANIPGFICLPYVACGDSGLEVWANQMSDNVKALRKAGEVKVCGHMAKRAGNTIPHNGWTAGTNRIKAKYTTSQQIEIDRNINGFFVGIRVKPFKPPFLNVVIGGSIKIILEAGGFRHEIVRLSTVTPTPAGRVAMVLNTEQYFHFSGSINPGLIPETSEGWAMNVISEVGQVGAFQEDTKVTFSGVEDWAGLLDFNLKLFGSCQ